MPYGVYVFDVIERLNIRPVWVRGVLKCSQQRYSRLRTGEYLFRHDEAERLVVAMRETYRLGRRNLFASNADILAPGRCRRPRGAKALLIQRAS